jgi:hypothetical protein
MTPNKQEPEPSTDTSGETTKSTDSETYDAKDASGSTIKTAAEEGGGSSGGGGTTAAAAPAAEEGGGSSGGGGG